MVDRPVLLLIDVQQGFDDAYWGTRNNPDAESNIAKLLDAWRRGRLPVAHVRHLSTNLDSPLRPGQQGCHFKNEAKPLPDENQFTKHVHSAFIGTELGDYLHHGGHSALVVVGLTTDHCVSTSVRMAADLGLEVVLVSDATATFDRVGHDGTRYAADEVHCVHMASLKDEFCAVLSTEQVMRSIEPAC